MKHLIVIAGFTIAGWTAPAHSQDEGPKVVPDTEYIIAQEIENGAPTQTVGIGDTKVLGAIPLEAYFEAMEGNELRVREVVLLPGAKIAVHSHDQRPAVVYVLEGELIEHRSDSEEPVIRKQGDIYFETLGIVHWSENISPNSTRVLAVDILPSDPE